MKYITRVFCALLLVTPSFGVFANGPVATTSGSNLTAFNPSNANNNQWASMTNGRNTGNSGAKADFGNCNALILRCAQPKCANGGCTDMNVAGAIVSGCVQSNENCKQYGNDLISYMSAQLVSASTAKVNEANAQQAAAAAAAAQQQSQQQMMQMQQQMQQMQQQMQQQNEANAQQMQQMQYNMQQQTQQALDSMSAAATAAAQQTESGITVAQEKAIEKGVSEDVLMRQQIGNQILQKIEDAETSLKELKTVMNNTFEYAGCDVTGSNCTGPKRVKIFKEKALKFFEPYDSVADKLSEALELAMIVGVDISDIYMLMNGACNRWAKYVCSVTSTVTYHEKVAGEQNDIAPCVNGRSLPGTRSRGGADCKTGHTVPPTDDNQCTFTELVDESTEDLTDVMLNPESNDGEQNSIVRLGCMSDAVNGLLGISRRSKKSASTIDIDTFERMITQDSPNSLLGKGMSVKPTWTGYCAVNSFDVSELERYTSTRVLPKELCVKREMIFKNNDVYDGITNLCMESCLAYALDEGNQSRCYKQCTACNSYPNTKWLPTGYNIVSTTETDNDSGNCKYDGKKFQLNENKGWGFNFNNSECTTLKCDWDNSSDYCDCTKRMNCENSGVSKWDGEKCLDNIKTYCETVGGRYDDNTGICSGLESRCEKDKGTWSSSKKCDNFETHKIEWKKLNEYTGYVEA